MGTYDEKFYRSQKDGSYESARIVIPLVKGFINPRTVVDMGCGLGTWLAVWKSEGSQVYGVDGDYVDRNMLYIEEEEFMAADLSKNFVNVSQKADLVESLEVAEHLPKERAVEFVRNLTEISDVVLFSAAIPFQGGTNHINEQWQSYWADIFYNFGYVPIDCIRPQKDKLQGCIICYAQNMIIYARETTLSQHPLLLDYYLKHRECQVLDYVDPQMFMNTIDWFIKLLPNKNS
ncbi:methyltransferase domain-containing protein [Selenomonas sp. AB3002]|uniref:methyltransferase domain-containing protein n=1 Tax=Selenomonas sp. AB3002 TaxID=1392502 RepID=UPI00068E8936